MHAEAREITQTMYECMKTPFPNAIVSKFKMTLLSSVLHKIFISNH